VTDTVGKVSNPVDGAAVKVTLLKTSSGSYDESPAVVETDAAGRYTVLDLIAGATYLVQCDAFNAAPSEQRVKAASGMSVPQTDFRVKVGLILACRKQDGSPCTQVTAGTPVTFLAEYDDKSLGDKDTTLTWKSDQGRFMDSDDPNEQLLLTDGTQGRITVFVTLSEVGSPSITATASVNAVPVAAQPVTGQLGVTLKRASVAPTRDQPLWAWIRNRTNALRFSGSGYRDFIDKIFDPNVLNRVPGGATLKSQIAELDLGTQIHGVGAYELLKTATQVFLLLECGVADVSQIKQFDHQDPLDPADEIGRLGESLTIDEISERLKNYLGIDRRLPYIDRVVRNAFVNQTAEHPLSVGLLASRVQSPCLLELIWSYWHEESMLVQTMNAISRRFQNVRGPGDRDPLAHLEIDPLRPLNNLLWGYIQDEMNLLTVKRRAYEYDHHYGLTIYGKAVPTLRPADSRSKFVEGFHNLLHMTSVFYKEDNDTTVIADGFPLLNALKEVHLLLAQGAHNQFGDLPWTARAEMLMQQWLLARPEMREFLQSRPMVPYKEAWMGQVDTMKSLQGWSDVTVTHFHDLGVYGEQILLSVRYGDWIGVNDEDSAKNWARYWRPEIQGYLHAYRAVTGVDLTNPEGVDYTMPAVHLQKRLAMQRTR
jgi:hypothetical protein